MNEDMEKLISLQKLDSELAGFDQAIARCEADTVKRKQAIQAEQEKLAALKVKIEHQESNRKANYNECFSSSFVSSKKQSSKS